MNEYHRLFFLEIAHDPFRAALPGTMKPGDIQPERTIEPQKIPYTCHQELVLRLRFLVVDGQRPATGKIRYPTQQSRRDGIRGMRDDGICAGAELLEPVIYHPAGCKTIRCAFFDKTYCLDKIPVSELAGFLLLQGVRLIADIDDGDDSI